MDDDYLDMDRKLAVVHQQWITQELVRVKLLVEQHDREIAILAITILILNGLLLYQGIQIRRLENGTSEAPSSKLLGENKPRLVRT